MSRRGNEEKGEMKKPFGISKPAPLKKWLAYILSHDPSFPIFYQQKRSRIFPNRTCACSSSSRMGDDLISLRSLQCSGLPEFGPDFVCIRRARVRMGHDNLCTICNPLSGPRTRNPLRDFYSEPFILITYCQYISLDYKDNRM